MTGNTARERELLEQLFQSGLVLADVRIDLAVRSFKVSIADQRRAAVTGTGDLEHVQATPFDDPVQMHIDEVLARRVPQWPTTRG